VEEKDDLTRRKASSDQMVIDLETRLAGETKARLSAEEGAAALRVEIEILKKVIAYYNINIFEQVVQETRRLPAS
jgi:hypothetical protein